MATRYQYYITGADGGVLIYLALWNAQTFTPAISHKITSVKLKLFRKNTPDTVTVSIRATDGSGHPTGGDLCFGTINGNGLTTNTSGAWYEITLGAGYDLDASTKYAIVVRSQGTSTSDCLAWIEDWSSPTYTRGNRESSGSSGDSWDALMGEDFLFEDWGEEIVVAVGRSFGFIMG